jgi:hypothetical protein
MYTAALEAPGGAAPRPSRPNEREHTRLLAGGGAMFSPLGRAGKF